MVLSLKKRVVSLELSRKLQELKITNEIESYWSWTNGRLDLNPGDKTPTPVKVKNFGIANYKTIEIFKYSEYTEVKGIKIIPAPDFIEICTIFDKLIESGKIFQYNFDYQYTCDVVIPRNAPMYWEVEDASLDSWLDSAAQVLINLKEKSII